ncbi:hypothetical protein [Brachybacterium squillarum]|uniref:hypothetical protein n=1 Tax=Brachybacterium squillarum TaxID=661979 RepID=UPI000262976F|nr:hypothetical protein [Brachybacterium squillarum]
MADVTSWPEPAEEPPGTPATGRRVRSFALGGPLEVDVRCLRGDVTLTTGPADRAQVTLTPRSPAGEDLAERTVVRLDQGRLTVDASAEGGVEMGQRLGAALQALLAPGQEEDFAERVAAGVQDVVAVSEGEAAMVDVEVMVPEHSRVVLSTGIGTVTVLGEPARCEARSRLTAGVGDIKIARAASGLIDVRTGLGAVEVAVPRGTAVLLDLATGTDCGTCDWTPPRSAAPSPGCWS